MKLHSSKWETAVKDPCHLCSTTMMTKQHRVFWELQWIAETQKKQEDFWKAPHTNEGKKQKGGKRELVYLRERRAVSNLAHLFHRWRLKRERDWTFLFTFLFHSGDFTTSPDMGDKGGFSACDVATPMSGRGNSHNRLQRLLTRHFNAALALPKHT